MQIFLFRPLVGWWVGIAEKWRSQFLGVGWRCGVSVANTAKANYLKNIFAPFLPLFLIYLFFYISSTCLYFSVFISLPNCTALASIASNVPAAWRGRGVHKGLGGRCTCKFAQMFGRAYTPALAKPPVSSRAFYSSIFFMVICTHTVPIRYLLQRSK